MDQKEATSGNESEAKKVNKVFITLSRIALCIVGVLLAVGAAILEDQFHPRDMTYGYFGLKLLDATGVSLFIMGMLTLVLEMGHWRKYFEERLEGIVVGQDYLNDLSPEALLRHQIKVFKSYYKDEGLSERGFVRYCLSKIHGYIVTPYRDGVENHLTVEVAVPSTLRIRDHLSYVCRKSKGRIQERVAWQANSLEVLQIESLSLELLPPAENGGGQQRIALLDIGDLERTEEADGSVTYGYSLGKWRHLDGLKVIFNASYTSEAAAFYTWRMMDPSEHVELSISYPTSLKMQFKPFLLEPQPTTTIDDPGFFQVVFDSWIMPRSGFAWKLLAPGVAAKVGIAQTVPAQTPVPPPPGLVVNRSTEALQGG
ncbi:MAG TPA: hypothetical protein VGH73_25435 [Thermoanaerobaculia bacterium]